MSTVLNAVHARAHAQVRGTTPEIRIALLGLGNVGSAVATLIAQPAVSPGRFSIVAALVRDTARPRAVDTSHIALTDDPAVALAADPDIVVEVLGGPEPARTIVLEALSRGIPVVTANKTLLAAHGDELMECASRTGTPLLYEASVLAGVPFLGTFARRPLARDVSALSGIVNGTSNFILSRMHAERLSFAHALADAQRAGYAEPDPAKDINGDDAVEKLCVLLRHLAGWCVSAANIETVGIREVEFPDLQQAVALDGFIRPVVVADWNSERLSAYAGPAFVSGTSQLARVNGVQNAVSLTTRWSGNLFFSGPGAGPTVTAATILDDVVEAQQLTPAPIAATIRVQRCGQLETGWFIRLTAADSNGDQDAFSLLTGLGIRLRRISPVVKGDGKREQWLLTHPCSREHMAAATAVVGARCGSAAWSIRAID